MRHPTGGTLAGNGGPMAQWCGPGAWGAPGRGGNMRRVSPWLDARAVPFMVTLFLAAAGAVYSLAWSALAHHKWQVYSDLWNSADMSLAVGHAHWSAVYAYPSQIESPPGFEYLLAPVMVLGHAIGLGTTIAEGHGFMVFGLILAPLAVLLAGSVLFALDAIARSWGFSEVQRAAVSLVAGLGVVSAVVFWGHPEDCIALALVLWAAVAADHSGSARASRAGWLLGAAVAFQPVALLGVAPVVARFGWRDLGRVAWRTALPSALLLLPEVLTSAAVTLHRVVDQPYFPADESSTPFGHFSRALGNGFYSGGTLRLVSTLAAAAVGYIACRRRHDLPWVLLVMSLAFTLRVLFESELLGFYFFPVVAICLLLTMRRSWSLFGACAVASVVCLILGNRRAHDIVLWWPAIMATTVLMVGLAAASLRRRPMPDPPRAPRRLERPVAAPA